MIEEKDKDSEAKSVRMGHVGNVDMLPELIRCQSQADEVMDEVLDIDNVIRDEVFWKNDDKNTLLNTTRDEDKGVLEDKFSGGFDEKVDNVIEQPKHEGDGDEAEDDSPIRPLGPFATPEEIKLYNFERRRYEIYKNHNMFYVPSYEDSPQLLPSVASVREAAAPTNAILMRSLNRESFTYNSWLSRNKYNDSTEHAHIVDDSAVVHPGEQCVKPSGNITTNTRSKSSRYHHRYSAVPVPVPVVSSLPPVSVQPLLCAASVSPYRRPSIASKKLHIVPAKRQQYTWIDGVHIKTRDADDLTCFPHAHTLVKAVALGKSPQECDERMFTFKVTDV